MTNHSSHLVLVGGGHTHSLVLRRLIDDPLPDTRVTLISDVEEAPYSGMLPGHVAGAYTHDEMHIDLPGLCRWAGAEFVKASVRGFEPGSRTLRFADRDPIEAGADGIVSFNVGSAPRLDRVPGAAEFAIPSKPVPRLLDGWAKVRRAARDEKEVRVILVGGGAVGVELALAMRAQLPPHAGVGLVHGGDAILPDHTRSARRALERALSEAGVDVIVGRRAVAVTAEEVSLDNRESLSADFVFWVTDPGPPSWLRDTGLALDERGFLRVAPTLEAVGQDGVFAAGDVASVEGETIPKAGVFAVRMAEPLAANLRASLAARALRSYHPQDKFLSLIGTADGRAVISRPGLPALRSRLVWWWKDRIDRRFMEQFVAGGGIDC